MGKIELWQTLQGLESSGAVLSVAILSERPHTTDLRFRATQ